MYERNKYVHEDEEIHLHINKTFQTLRQGSFSYLMLLIQSARMIPTFHLNFI